MSATLWQQIPLAVMDQAVAQTFQMLVESDASPGAACSEQHDDVSMAVYCEDAQQRALIVSCSRPLALSLTSRILETPSDQLHASDVSDAIGEVVNVIAGSLRGLVKNPGGMSTPFAVTPADLCQLTCFDRQSYLVEQQSLTLYRI